jgi:hypothetical protein
MPIRHTSEKHASANTFQYLQQHCSLVFWVTIVITCNIHTLCNSCGKSLCVSTTSFSDPLLQFQLQLLHSSCWAVVAAQRLQQLPQRLRWLACQWQLQRRPAPAKQRDANKQCFRDLPQGCMHCLLAFANKQCFRDLPQGAEGCLHLHICMYLPEKRTHASKAVLRGSRCKVLQGMQGLGECRHLLGPPAAATRWAPAAAWVSVAP